MGMEMEREFNVLVDNFNSNKESLKLVVHG